MRIAVSKFEKDAGVRLRNICHDVSRYAPWWCEKIFVVRDSDSAAIGMFCEVKKHYRFITIFVSALSLEDNDADIRETMLHEIMHCHNEGIVSVMNTFVKDFIPDENQGRIFSKIFAREMEAQTEDLRIVFDEILGNNQQEGSE